MNKYHDAIVDAYMSVLSLQESATQSLKKKFPGTAIEARAKSLYSPEAESKKIMSSIKDPSKNELLHSANQYVSKNFSSTLDFSNPPESSLKKQYVIGKAYDLAAAKNPEYEKAVYGAYQKQMPRLTEGKMHHDYNSLVAGSYGAAAKETKAQARIMPLKLQLHSGDKSYHNSQEMLRDIHLHKNLTVYKGGDRHEFFHNVDPKTKMTENETFRGVHDAFGHGLNGASFGPKGEEAAYHAHSQMYSPLAKVAVASETRGQNSKVNYSTMNLGTMQKMEQLRKQHNDHVNSGDIGKANEVSTKLRDVGGKWKYAQQAAVALPPEMIHHDYSGHVPESIKHLLIDKQSKVSPNYDTEKDHLGLVKLAKHYNTGSHLLTNPNLRGKLNSESALSDLHHIAGVHGFSGVTKNPFKE
jgi:hypothetical protein